ncbi:MAG TPA: hypothetical protein DD412_07045 [Holosporales bacterium]|nr:hypothetical protein [Holosporales bacterium]
MKLYCFKKETLLAFFMLFGFFGSDNMACASHGSEPKYKRTKRAPVQVMIDLTGGDEDVPTAEESPQKKKKPLPEQELEQGFLEKWTMGSPLILQTLVECRGYSKGKYKALETFASSLLPTHLTSFYNRRLVLKALMGHSEENIRGLATGAPFLLNTFCGVGSYTQIIKSLQKYGGKEICFLLGVLKENRSVFFPKQIGEEERVLIIENLSDAPTSFLPYIAQCAANMPAREKSLSAYIGKLSNQAVLYELARFYDDRKDLPKAKVILWRLHKEGFLPATHSLGHILYGQDKKNEAKELFEHASREKFPASMYSLAQLLYINAKTQEEKEESKRWFKKAEEHGYVGLTVELDKSKKKDAEVIVSTSSKRDNIEDFLRKSQGM